MSTLIANLPPVVALRYHDSERFNIAAGSKKFDCKFLEPGFVSYRDIPGGKLELLKKQTIERAMDTAVGIPLTIGHVMVTDENRQNLENGVVTGWYFNSEDGWYHVTGTVDTDEALSLIRKGHRPSCGFKVLDLGPGGRDHGIRFDQEISDLIFNHLAIVERPRYADADFRLNSITSANPTMNVFKFLKKLLPGQTGPDGKTVEKEITISHETSGDTEVEIDGKMVRLNELFESYMKSTAEAFTITPETALEVSGKVVTMGQLADAHRANAARANAITETPEQKLARETKEAADKKTADDQRANEIAAEKKKTDDAAAQQRENDAGKSAFFTLRGASATPKINGGYSTTSGSLKEKCELGAKRY